MPLESGTYISDLVITNPDGADGIADGDGHLRLIKAAIKASFTGITGAVTATHTQLNLLAIATVAAFLGTPTSANLAALVSDETGTGALVFANGPTLVAPVLGTPASGTLTNCTIALAGVTGVDGTIRTFLGTPTSANLLAAMTTKTGTGNLVFATSPTLVTPVLGAATATSINGLTLTSSTGTFTLTSGKTFSVTNTLTLTGTDGTTLNINGVSTLNAGYYTPTLTNVSGITSSSVAANAFQFLRVGNTVTVSGACSVDSSAVGVWFLDLSLPIAPTFADSADLSGVCMWEGSNGSAAYEIGRCYANVAGGKCSIAVYGVNSSAERTLTVHFTYYVG